MRPINQNTIPFSPHLRQLVTDAPPKWHEIGIALDAIFKDQSWKDLGFSSFDQFRIDYSKRANIDKSSLHRYRMSSIKYEYEIRQYIGVDKAPPLSELPDNISAEGIEVLIKLKNKIDIKYFELLMKRYLNDQCSAFSLRKLWKKMTTKGVYDYVGLEAKFFNSYLWKSMNLDIIKVITKPQRGIEYAIVSKANTQICLVAISNSPPENCDHYHYKISFSKLAPVGWGIMDFDNPDHGYIEPVYNPIDSNVVLQMLATLL